MLEKGIKDFDRATSNQRGKALTEFYLKEIGIYLFQIYDDDIETNICDGKGDLGIDFIVHKSGEWLILQSKYKGQSSSITIDEIAGFFQIYSRISDLNTWIVMQIIN